MSTVGIDLWDTDRCDQAEDSAEEYARQCACQEGALYHQSPERILRWRQQRGEQHEFRPRYVVRDDSRA